MGTHLSMACLTYMAIKIVAIGVCLASQMCGMKSSIWWLRVTNREQFCLTDFFSLGCAIGLVEVHGNVDMESDPLYEFVAWWWNPRWGRMNENPLCIWDNGGSASSPLLIASRVNTLDMWKEWTSLATRNIYAILVWWNMDVDELGVQGSLHSSKHGEMEIRSVHKTTMHCLKSTIIL